jgi:hypothetical protein
VKILRYLGFLFFSNMENDHWKWRLSLKGAEGEMIIERGNYGERREGQNGNESGRYQLKVASLKLRVQNTVFRGKSFTLCISVSRQFAAQGQDLCEAFPHIFRRRNIYAEVQDRHLHTKARIGHTHCCAVDVMVDLKM